MRRGHFTEDQIIRVLAEHEVGLKAKELCRKHGISDPTFYKWEGQVWRYDSAGDGAAAYA